MADSAYKIILEACKERGIDLADLEDWATANGFEYPLVYIEIAADPVQIKMIAAFVGIPPSTLFSVMDDASQYALALFEETWPSYEARISVTRREAWRRVEKHAEFKGEQSFDFPSQIRLILEGLVGPRYASSACDPLECDDKKCNLKCKITGWSQGPEI
jgi:hypothetical protein